MSPCWRPLVSDDPVVPPGALRIAGGWTWATHAERIDRGGRRVVPVSDIPDRVRDRLSAPRAPVAGLAMDAPRIMGILNTTPDSFSDGGVNLDPGAAAARGRAMVAEGAAILDIGGESTRPGAKEVPETDERARVLPVIGALAGAGAVVSVDTRKAGVARAALAAGAVMVNDVSAMTFDAGMAAVVAGAGVPVVLMHARGDPETMQDQPRYDDVLLDVYDALEARIVAAEAAGIPRARIVVDPGIGFGKTLVHNLSLLSGLSLFHGLGCALMVGASRKRFVGTLTGVDVAAERATGSVAAALAAVSQGVQIMRVHDTLATKQGLTVWRAARGGMAPEN